MKVEDIVNLPRETYLHELLSKGKTKVNVECYDGSKVTTFAVLAFVWAYFEFNRKWNVPVSVKQIPGPKEIPSNKMHFKYMNVGLKVVFEGLDRKVPLNELAELGFDIQVNQINQPIMHLEEYSMALDAEDYWEIENDPEVKVIRKDMREGVAANRTSAGKFKFIQAAYEKFAGVVKDQCLGRLRNNGIAQLIISGTSKITQVNQGLIARGFCSDVNSDFFAEPVMSSFAEGLSSPYEYALETCSGAKAFMYQKDPMSDTEYLHRLVQMIAATFQNLHIGDCGSTVTYPFHVEERHLPYIIGKYYITDDGKVVEIVAGDNSHLVGRTINMRCVSGCQVDDPVGACTVCCGSNSLNFAKGANLGHTASTKFMGTGSQKVLSVKHEDLASLSMAMRVGSELIDYLRISSNNREVKMKKRNVTLAIPEKCCENIRYIYYVDDVRSLNITEFSHVHYIEVAENGDEGFGEVYKGSVGDKGEVVNMSPQLLEYLKEDSTRLKLAAHKRSRYYFIDLSDFPEDDAVFLAPFKHFDMLIQHRLTKRFLYSPKSAPADSYEHGPCLTDFGTFGEASTALLELTMEKLGINLSVLEMAIYAFTITDANDYDFRPVRGSNTCQFMPMEALYNNRSIAAKLVAEKQLEVLKSPLIITNDKRSPHPFEGLYDE